MIRDDDVHGVEPIHLMSQQICSLVVGVVCEDEAFG